MDGGKALSVSKFDVSGTASSKGLKGMILIADVDYVVLTGWQDCGSILCEILLG